MVLSRLLTWFLFLAVVTPAVCRLCHVFLQHTSEGGEPASASCPEYPKVV